MPATMWTGKLTVAAFTGVHIVRDGLVVFKAQGGAMVVGIVALATAATKTRNKPA
jgi:hypothetical protein